jgi:DNA damage-inducible protein 1
MKVDVTTVTGELYSVECSPDLTLENFKAYLYLESGIPTEEMGLSFDGEALRDDKKCLTEYGIKDESLLLLERKGPHPGDVDNQSTEIPHIDWSSIPVHSDGSEATAASSAQVYNDVDQDDPEVIRKMFVSNPYQMSLLRERNPPLADALESGDRSRLAAALEQQRKILSDRNVERIRTMNADPMDPQAQGVIAENIRLENVQSNMDTAIEYNPEAFGVVTMLYIECQVNGHPVKAFVDSGAQTTIMSVDCAKRCEIMRLVDRRFGGIARGVGIQRIIGRVHLAQVEVGGAYLACAFSIMQDQPMEMLLGLDMLKRHQVTCYHCNR